MSGLDSIGKSLFGASNLSEVASQVGEGFFGTDYMRDYAHASKLMVSNGMALAPKQKFLFHTFFNVLDPKTMLKSDDKGLVGALVKSIQLPSFKLDTKEYVQYNRKRLVHNKIEYDPITIKLHDDGEGNVTDMWYNYYQYHFADAKYEYDQGISMPDGKTDYNSRDLYDGKRSGQTAGWGKTVTSTPGNVHKPAFFKDIKIYGFNRGGFILYTLINPVITAWTNDTYDYAEGSGVMEHTVTIQYESVKYYDSSTVGQGGALVDGFGHDHPGRYDTKPGALGGGSTTSLSGQGGLTDTLGAISTDLANGNLGGAIQKAGASARTFGSLDNLKNVVSTDTKAGLQQSLVGAAGGVKLLNFPSAGSNTNNNTTASPKKAE